MVRFYTSEIAKKRIRNPLPKPSHCHKCGSKDIRLTTNDVIYGKMQGDWPLIWICLGCEAAVSCHPETEIPVGFMADRETRQLRRRVHRNFDPLWKGPGSVPRQDAYRWLANKMGLDPCVCHISYFDASMCRKALKILHACRRSIRND